MKKTTVLLILIFVVLNLSSIQPIAAQQTVKKPDFEGFDNLFTARNVNNRFKISGLPNVETNTTIEFNMNKIYGTRVDYSELYYYANNNQDRRIMGFAHFRVPKNSFEREAMLYSTEICIISFDNQITYNHWFQFRLISLNASHVGVNFIHGRYANGGNWAQYVNTNWYIPIQPNYYDFDFVIDSSIHYINGYKHSSLFICQFNLEDGSKNVFVRYMNSAILENIEFHHAYIYFSNSLPVSYTDTEISYITAANFYGHQTWFNNNGIYSVADYLANTLSNRADLRQFTLETVSVDTYWTYSAFYIKSVENKTIKLQTDYAVYNETTNQTETKTHEFDYNYTLYSLDSRENRFYYRTDTFKNDQFGNWGWLNVLRNSFVFVLNAVIFIFQAILYLLIIAFNYLILYILFQVFILLWNYPIYWLVYAIIAVIFGLSFFFVWLWNQAVILWKTLIEPVIQWIWNWIIDYIIIPIWNTILSIIDWLKNGGLKILFDLYFIVLSFIIATLIWILSFGSINFTEIQIGIQTILLNLNQTIFEFITIFFANFAWILASSALYLLLIGLIYVKYVIAKARGYIQRANRLQSMINVYKLPIVLIVRLVQYVIGFIQGGAPTDGANQ